MTAAAIALCACLAGCGGGGSSAPGGWRVVTKNAAQTVYADSADPKRTLSVSAPVTYGGSLKDLSTKLTIDTVLRVPGAKMEQATMFPPCPGEAGLLIFTRAKTPERIEIAFTQWNGKAVTATYRAPSGAKPGKAVTQRMRQAVCSG